MKIVENVADAFEACMNLTHPVGLVPTMGYLHKGHLALIRQAVKENGSVVVSIFVNPIQFGPDEDFIVYPRDVCNDLKLLKNESVDVVFMPTVEEMYPKGYDTWVYAEQLESTLEGKHRPVHFKGVSTVVTKLFNLVRPSRAYFGQKDYQQLILINQMVIDLNMAVGIVMVPTIRESDGLAVSSRNILMSKEERDASTIVYRALSTGLMLWGNGEYRTNILIPEMLNILSQEPLVTSIDYLNIVDSTTMEDLADATKNGIVLVAAWVGNTRIVDNILLRS
jgi:pantoate--beta-alanine ligase